MMDKINSTFLFAASLFYVLNLVKLRKDKEVKGYNLGSIVFFTTWNCWNVVFYFVETNMFWTKVSSMFVAVLNIVYLTLLFKYRRQKKILEQESLKQKDFRLN